MLPIHVHDHLHVRVSRRVCVYLSSFRVLAYLDTMCMLGVCEYAYVSMCVCVYKYHTFVITRTHVHKRYAQRFVIRRVSI